MVNEDREAAKMALNETNFKLDDRKDNETMNTGWIGVCVTVSSAVLSILVSVLVKYLIYGSEKRLVRSIYHRILFGISVADSNGSNNATDAYRCDLYWMLRYGHWKRLYL